MLEEEIKKWLGTDRLKLRIFDQYFHLNAKEIIDLNFSLKFFILTSLEQEININSRIKKNKNQVSPGIEAGALNKEIRRLICLKEESIFEKEKNKNLFYPLVGKIAGFDFALINNIKNLISIRNLYLGEEKIDVLGKKWYKDLGGNLEFIKLAKIYDLDEFFEGENQLLANDDLNDKPLIVGDIQFGNWALVYKDFFKLFKTDVLNSIDCLIYIVPTNNLFNYLSDGIVNFTETKKILKEFDKAIPIPVWLIGLDVDL